MTTARGPCVACKRQPATNARGLCRTCDGRRAYDERADEPTAAELDAMVAERMKDLPAWFHADSRGQPKGVRVAGALRFRLVKRKHRP